MLREALEKTKKALAGVLLVAVVSQMSLLVLPGQALAATSISGGTTDEIVNGSGESYILSNLTLISELDNNIETTNGIKIDISHVTPLSSAVVDFDTSATVTAEVFRSGDGGLAIDNPPSITADDIEFTVSANANADDYVVISGIKVKANIGGIDSNTYSGSAHLRARTGAVLASVYSRTFYVDAQPPAIDSIVSDAATAGVLKIGDSVNFTLHPRHIEPNAVINGSYNGRALNWTTNDGGINYSARYTVALGDSDQISPLQLEDVVLTDYAGNTSLSFDGSDVVKTIDANAPGIPIINPISSPVNATNQTITGTAALGSLVKVTGGALPKEQQLAGGVTEYSIEVPLTQDANNNLSVTATDAAGNVSQAALATIVEDSTSPSVTLGTSPNGQEFETGDTLVFAGTTEPGAQVKLEIFSDVIVLQTVADAFGQWGFRVSASEIGVGTHRARITATDAAGNPLVLENINFRIFTPVVDTAVANTPAEPVVLAEAPPTPSTAVQPGNLKPTITVETPETSIKAAEDTADDSSNTWQTIITIIAIIIIALGVGTAGYYAYEWWATKGEGDTGGESWDNDKGVALAKKTTKKTSRRKKSSRRGGSSRSAGSRW